jgi:ssDNA-binding replication factor A large subunit
MRNIEVVGRVTQIFEVKEFVRADNSMGKVGSFVMGDDTGTARVVCWGNQADTLSKLTPGVPIKLSSGMVRENARGYKEIHLNESSKVVLNPVGVAIPEVKAAVPTRKTIRELTESEDQVEILGTIVQVFDLKFFEICPSCGVRLKELEGQWVCEEHNIVQPDYAYLLNLYLDDGTENMRIVLFRNQAERLLNKAREEILAFRTAPETFEPFKTKLLGEQFRFVGRAKHNTFFDRLEFIANQLFPVKELTT